MGVCSRTNIPAKSTDGNGDETPRQENVPGTTKTELPAHPQNQKARNPRLAPLNSTAPEISQASPVNFPVLSPSRGTPAPTVSNIERYRFVIGVSFGNRM